MSELLRRGFIAALAPAGVPNADTVVTDVVGGRLCTIQVKTRSGKGSDGGWHMSEKHEKLTEDRLFYCFVDFKNSDEKPDVYVMPASVVARVLTESHAKWLDKPAKNGTKHKDTTMRRLLPDYSNTFGSDENPYGNGWLKEYRGAWEKLGLRKLPPEQINDST